MTRLGLVYFVEQAGFIKIGWTAEIGQRLSTLQVGAPAVLNLLGSIAGTEDDEAHLHHLFSHLRVRGEWFAATDAMRGHVKWLSSREAAPSSLHEPEVLRDDHETHLLEALLAVPDGAGRVRAQGVGPDAFTDGPARRVAEAVFQLADEAGQVEAAKVLGALADPSARDLAAALIEHIDPTKEYARELDVAATLLIRARERRIAELSRHIRLTKDPARTSELLAEQQRLKTMNVEQRRAEARS